MTKAVDTALNEALSLLENIRTNVQLQQAARVAGVTEEILSIGERMYKQLQGTKQQHTQLRSQRPTSSEEIKQSRAALWKTYIEHVEAGRARILNEGIKALLQLEGDRESGVMERQGQIFNFYTSALDSETAQAELARCGITREELEAGREAVVALGTTSFTGAEARLQLPELTKRRTKELRHLRTWMRSTRGLMEPALGDDKHLKALIGITEPAPRKKRKKKAEKQKAIKATPQPRRAADMSAEA